MSKLTVILLIANFLVLNFISVKLGQIGFVLIFIKYFIDMGVFVRTKFMNGVLENSDLFYWEYKGEYKQLHNQFKKLREIYSKSTLNKNLWNIFGIYYDDPKKTDPMNCRAVIGFQYENESNKKENPELNENTSIVLKAQGFKHKKITKTNCIIAKYPFVNFLSIIFAIRKFYTSLEEKIKDTQFLKKYGLENKVSKFTCTFEIYKEKNLEFGVPLENDKQFMLYH